MLGVQTQLTLQPEIGRPLVHVLCLAQRVQRIVRLDALAPQPGVGESAHRAAVMPVRGYIGIARRPAGTEIQMSALLADILSVDFAGRGRKLQGPRNRADQLAFHSENLFSYF